MYIFEKTCISKLYSTSFAFEKTYTLLKWFNSTTHNIQEDLKGEKARTKWAIKLFLIHWIYLFNLKIS